MVGDHGLLVFTEVSQQVGPTEFVVEGRATQRALGHDLQRAGNVLRLALQAVGHAAPELGDGKSGEAGLGLGAASGSALVADLTARAGGRTGVRRDGGRMVVGFHLHQDVLRGRLLFVSCHLASAAHAGGGRGHKTLHHRALHHRGVVRIGHQHVLRVLLVGVADHAKQAARLGHAVDGELGIENLVAAVLAIGLGEHHQLHVGGVAAQLGEGVYQVFNLVASQGQAPVAVGRQEGRLATTQHIHMGHRGGFERMEQIKCLGAVQHGAFGHAVVQQGRDGLQLLGGQRGFAQQRVLEGQPVFHQAFHTLDAKATVVCNVGGLGGPGRDRSETRADHDRGSVRGAGIRVTIGQQRSQVV